MISLSSIGYALPEPHLTPVEPMWRRLEDPRERAFFQTSGIETVVASPLDDTQLAILASQDALDRVDMEPTELDFVLLVQPRAPAFLMASDATRLQRELGASRAVAFSVGDLGCVSICAALQVAEGLLATNPRASNVLIVSASKPLTRTRLRYPVTIIGDGGIATVVTRGDRSGVLGVETETDGTFSDLFRVDYRQVPEPDWKVECTDRDAYSFTLALESRDRFKHLNERILSAHGIELARVDHLMMQNVSAAGFAFHQNAFGRPFHPACRRNLKAYGHLGSMDILLNYARALEDGELQPGDHVLILNNSPVAAWSSVLIRV